MADMRDAMKKAGLVSEKDLRQSKHKQRVKRKKLGEEGLAEERRKKDQAIQEEMARKRATDQKLERERESEREVTTEQTKLTSLLREGNLLAREGGPRRFYFECPGGQICFLDVSPNLSRQLAQGEAAIIDCQGVLKGDFIAVPGKVAHELKHLAADRILSWNIPR